MSLALVWSAIATAEAQHPSDGMLPMRAVDARQMTAGSAGERTITARALLDSAVFITSIRPQLAHEIRQLEDLADSGLARHFTVATPWAKVWWNSTRAVDDRDGAAWQGRGATVAMGGGIIYERGPLNVALRPMIFVAQNLAFEPRLPLPPGNFRHPLDPNGVDWPYRFGDERYARLDPGESHVRFMFHGVGAGATTTLQRWGPSAYYPLLMSVEAAGYPRIFLESRGVTVPYVGRFSGQWSLGSLRSSGYSSRRATETEERVLPALVVAYVPGFFPGLEIGGSRAFHMRGDDFTWDAATLPFAGLLKKSNPTGEGDEREFNQVASIFARVAPPGAGIEVHGEFYREDHNVDWADFVGEPDHQSAYTIGLRRVWARDDSTLSAVSGEVLNSRTSHLARVRTQGLLHTHSRVVEGHTYRGQPLGSSAVLAGGGATIAYERASTDRSIWVAGELRRFASSDEEGGTLNGRLSGTYSVAVARTALNGRWLRRWSLRVGQGFGEVAGTNVTLGFSLSHLMATR